MLIPLPTPPYVIALGKVFHPGIVAFIGAVANRLAALAKYHIIAWLFSKTAAQGSLAPVFTGVTPIPFELFRRAAILIRHNVPNYLLAVFVGRFIRYYFTALIRHLYPIPNRHLIIMVIALLMIPAIGVFAKRLTASRPFNLTKIS